ncbi:hypothetical protein C8Q74DRAFT_150703 [Fomes fomentarius]|nr:hypothetical protein C8Q74DRAFT_150703 [Fomes fomentarius]
MCPYPRDGEDGRGPLSNVEINNVPRHHRLDSSPYHSAAAKHGPEILRSMSGQPGGSGRFLERPANGIDYSSGAAAGNRAGRLTPEVRYTKRSHYMEGDKVIVCVCEHRLATWRHGVVAAFERWPVRYEGLGQYAYAVLYPSEEGTVMGYFNPTRMEILYDELLNDTNGPPPGPSTMTG